uniref:HECT domain-containing protein n=1 Tax=Maylandia zebra TaxID=106582 RepID=A0A3P9CPW6_9CICH
SATGNSLGERTLTKDEEAFVKALRPGHILAFATGSSKVPAIGFQPAPKITFIHDESKHLPIAHTCANKLQLFVNETTMAFHYCFLVALMNGALFSTI